VDQAVGVAGAFLPPGALVTFTEGRRADNTQKLLVAKDSKPVSWPMAVLVDGGSASASEILAGALQDLDRALVVGVNSYGKGTVQSIIPLRNRAGAIKLTTAYYHTPSGRSIHRKPPGTDDEGDDEEADVAPADSSAAAAADTAARPAFKTRAGRKVYGGGGISPDLEVKADSLAASRTVAVTPATLAHDPVFQSAADVLRRAKAPADVFAFAAANRAPAPAKRPAAKPAAPHGSPSSH